MEVLPSSPRHPPKYGSAVVQDALEQLASIDLIELCKEARIERCRATRDLSSCGRYVQHVLNSCGHASLCAECSQRCDVCPICRTPIPLPDNGSRVRLRLYYKCMEAGLISKQHDERFQEKKEHNDNVNMDIQRLYSLFNVALQNNLVSLICHYITDVCMDESAVSSDPLRAFLLDEVVIKEWCKRAVTALISEIGMIYRSGLETMKAMLSQLQKFAVQLAGISSVLEVMISSFKETFSAQLFESTMKAKQHLEAMIWCIRHQFLENICSRYIDYASWSSFVLERKEAAKERQWPDFSGNASSNMEANRAILFVEQALQNLGIEQSYVDKEEVDISCLQDENSSPIFCCTIDPLSGNRYPFKNLRVATDVLFLHGPSDMVIAKQAIFLYYLFDRHWTKPDSEWRYLVDDFAATFGISRKTLLECFVYCLLDDNSSNAVEEACRLLPKISSKDTHPNIAQVLLERQKPDVALVLLKCTGRDGICTSPNIEHDSISYLREAVTAVRVRIEYGHLTEAFMYQRSYCSRVKEQMSKDIAISEIANIGSWMYHVEVLVTEICTICIERNIVDKMIELPWSSEEAKYLHKCLLECAREMPSRPYGSLLVVFYLQRYQYLEAYKVDRSLQSFEQSTLETASDDIASKIRSIAHWRQGLVDKCVKLLPEVQRDELKTTSVGDHGQFSVQSFQMTSPVNLSDKSPDPATQLSSLTSSVVQKRSSPFHLRNVNAVTSFGSPISTAHSEFGKKASSILQRRLVGPLGTPMSSMRSTAGGLFPPISQNEEGPCFKDTKEVGYIKREANYRGLEPADHLLPLHFNLGPKAQNTSFLKPEVDKFTPSHGKSYIRKGQFDFGSRAERPFIFSGSEVGQTGQANKFDTTGDHEDQTQNTIVRDKENLLYASSAKPAAEKKAMLLSLGNKSTPVAQASVRGGSRWRSDESSEDEEDNNTNGYMESGASVPTRRRPRFSRR